MPPLFKRLIPVLLVALLVAAALLRALWPADEKKSNRSQSVPVRVAQAVAQDYPLTFTSVGRVQPSETVTLRARIDGQVEQVLMQEGRQVQTGDILIRLDDAELKARLIQAEATLARDEAQLANARIELERNETLKARNFIADDVLRTSRTNVTSLAAAVKGSRAAVENARLQLSYTVVRAPFAGRIGARVVSPGTAVRVNDTVLAVINRVRPVQVAFGVPEKFLGQLQPLREGRRMPVVITADSDATLRAEGAADFIDNAVDPASGTIQVKATFANKDDRLTPGALVRVSLALDTLEGAITVPTAALQQNGDTTTVYVVDATQKAQLRRVKVSDQRNDIAAIAAGLKAGETVVIDGHLRLTPDAPVKIQGQGKGAPK